VEPHSSELAEIEVWFAARGRALDLYRGGDGSHRAAFFIGEHVRLFGMAATYLDAARQARDMLIEFETDQQRAGGQTAARIYAAARSPSALGDPLMKT
jgi:hypothetical protein